MSEVSDILAKGQDFTSEELNLLLQNLHKFSTAEQNNLLEVVEELEERKRSDKARDSLLAFAQAMMPEYKIGPHHKKLARLLEDMAHGRKDRVTVSIAPRFGKSQLTSIFFPAWFIGNWPHKSIMMVSHTADLATDFGRKVRNLVNTPEYKRIFPDVGLSADSKSAGRWDTNKGGSYYAVGIGGAIAGRGAHLLCVAANEKVHVKGRGKVPIKDVQAGEHVLGHRRYNTTKKIMRSSHTTGVRVDGRLLSNDHLVWTFTRGWQRAVDLTTHDLIDSVSFTTYVEAHYERAKDAWRELHPGVQHLGANEAAVQQPECGKLSALRRTRDFFVQSVEKVCQLLGGHGYSADPEAHAGQNKLGRGLHARELPMGRPGNAGVQPAQWAKNHGAWRDTVSFSVGAENRADTRPDQAPHRSDGTEPGGGDGSSEAELGNAPRDVSQFGWAKRAAVWLYRRSCQSRGGSEGFVVGCVKAAFASQVFGLLVGAKRLSSVETVQCGSSNRFYNLYVSDNNTFYVDGLMTHNCIDDPHNEQDVLNGNFEVFDRAYEWYAYGARTRLMPGGAVVAVATRWAEQDLIGRLQKDMVRNPEADQWEVVEFPALFEKDNVVADAPEEQKYVSLWPEQWPVKSLLRTKASMPPFQWSAQYMQKPTGKDAAIIKRDWWQLWEEDDPPPCEYIIMSLDAAAEKNNRSDYTALTTWGVFYADDVNGVSKANIILLNSLKERLEFPELKKLAYENYVDWEPDSFIIEKKSSGTPLFQEFRRSGIPVQEYTPHRGTGDKTARLNAVSDMFSSGMVWYPAGRRWAEEVVDEVCGFPAMPNDDLVDSTVMALMRFRNGGFIELPTDIVDDEDNFEPVRAAYY